ncbi:hypothetical protein niasHS_018122 [Heterodera schachtii]|uniref:Ubiquitin-like domain-containing protein n=1 Tax=Heterodera schachtii TaxID=97005 RepID=A0ABD2HQ56_HETSC
MPRIANNLNNFIGQIKLRRHTTDGTAVELRHNETLDECGINGVDGIDVTYVEKAGGKDSNKTMEDYGIKQGARIIVSWDEFEIFVEYEGEKYPFEVNAVDTVHNLKEKIQQSISILPEKQVLSRDPDGHFQLCNEQTIGYCGFAKDGTVFLSLAFYLSVRKSHEAEDFRVNGTDTVKSMKDRIRQRIGLKWNCESGEIKLRKSDENGTEFEDNDATLDDYGILPGKFLLME